MQVTEVATEGLKRSFDVVVQAAEVDAARNKRLAAVARDLRLPGFRPGKVPMSVVKNRYGTAINGEVLEEAVADFLAILTAERRRTPRMGPALERALKRDKDLEAELDEILRRSYGGTRD